MRPPSYQLSDRLRKVLLATVNTPRFRDLSPQQIVPRLADEGRYIGSEATRLRILRREGQLAHRDRAKAPVRTPAEEHIATGPNQLWSWDISYLKTTVRGRFYFLYFIVDSVTASSPSPGLGHWARVGPMPRGGASRRLR